MAGPVFTNNAVGTLAAAYSATATALTLTSGQGSLFPAPGAGEWFPVTIVNASNQIEIVRCTGRTADTLTVQRGQEGTAARALAAGEKAEHRMTAALLAAIRDKPVDPSQIPDGAISASKLAANSVTGDKIANGTITGPDIAGGTLTPDLLAPNTAVSNLGFTPVQQGGGAGQASNKVMIGWAGSFLKAQIDSYDYGNILSQRDDGTVGSAGFRGLPQSVVNNDYWLALSDIGKTVLHSSGSHSYLINTAAASGWQNGAVIKINNAGGGVTIAAASGVNLLWVPNNVYGNRVLAAPASVVLEFMWADNWWVYGVGIS